MAETDDDAEVRLGPEPDYVAAWLQAIDSASAEEKDWRKDAEQAVCAYRGEDEKSKYFNIYHANIETIVPALYNSTPTPDVRRRFADDDRVAKAVADMLERALSFSIDAYDFDDMMLACVRDMAMPGRGVARVRYRPQYGPDGLVAYEEAVCEYVPWRSFRRGPARVWEEVPWLAFEHYLDRATIERQAPEIAAELPYTYSASTKDSNDRSTEGAPRFGKRARVWEIWDRAERQVHFICPDYGARRLWMTGDPLGLQDFFPTPRPMQALATTDSLVPIASYRIYARLIEELNDVSRRILRLVGQLRVRGGYAGITSDIKAVVEADDGELVPLTGAEMFVSTGTGIDKAITWFPIENIVAALNQLVQQREIIKATIYEVTKIADVMRGASVASETATAQQIKAQWGSVAVQRQQAEVARFARDLFRLKAEIICNKFSMDTLQMMTGIRLPTLQEKQAAQTRLQAAQAAQQAPQPQPASQMPGQPPAVPQAAPAPVAQPSEQDIEVAGQPAREEVEQLLRQGSARNFRVDIESDSTIRGDLTRNQQQMAGFVQGIAQYVGAVGPMVKEGIMPGHVALELLSAFSRQYKLGKQAEDTLDQWADEAKAAAKQPKQQQPDPKQVEAMIRVEVEKAVAQIKMQTEQAKATVDRQGFAMDQQAQQAEHNRDMQKLGAEAQLENLRVQRQAMQPFTGPQPVVPFPGQR